MQKLRQAEEFSMKCIALSGTVTWTCNIQSLKSTRLEKYN